MTRASEQCVSACTTLCACTFQGRVICEGDGRGHVRRQKMREEGLMVIELFLNF